MSEEIRKKIEELEEELANTKANKRTEHAIGLLKSKISRLYEELEKQSSKGKKGEGYAVKKEGDATIGLVGKPSVGKSTILSKLTNKESKIGEYEFTTLEVIPGLLNYNFIDFQVLDLPGIIEGASKNRGFGKKVISVVRNCDLVIVMVDARKPVEEATMIEEELRYAGIRLNKKRPDITINKTSEGGIRVLSNFSKDTLSDELIKEVLRDNKIRNAEVIINEKGLSIEDLLETVLENVIYTKASLVLNKTDLTDEKTLRENIKALKDNFPSYDVVALSGAYGELESLKEFIYQSMNFIKVYLKEPRKEPDLNKPLIIREGDSIREVCENIHKDFIKKFKFAKIKGSSAKFQWQRVGIDHIVHDQDIIELNLAD